MSAAPAAGSVDAAAEQEFYRLLADYLDLERNTARPYSQSEYTLARMAPLAALFDHPERRLKLVHVAGTKGKGSTCHYLTALLRAAGHRVGTFTSPHLISFRERLLLDGQPGDYASLLEHTAEVEGRIRASGMVPTFFEILTILGLSYFVRQGCRYAVLETGIGGLLDCTNYIQQPICTAITSISFDHTELLGNTIEQIASQKAGIIKPGVPVVCGRQPFAAAEEVIRQAADRLGAPFILPRPLPPFLPPAVVALPAFQQENLATAVEAGHQCGLEPDWANFVPPAIPGRCQCLCQTPLVVIDAAHNADSARRLVEAVRQGWPNTPFTCVLGIVAGKDAEGILRQLAQLTRRFILTHPRTAFKGSQLHTLEQLATALGLEWQTIPTIGTAADLPADQPLLFTGSFFTATIGVELFGPANR